MGHAGHSRLSLRTHAPARTRQHARTHARTLRSFEERQHGGSRRLGSEGTVGDAVSHHDEHMCACAQLRGVPQGEQFVTTKRRLGRCCPQPTHHPPPSILHPPSSILALVSPNTVPLMSRARAYLVVFALSCSRTGTPSGGCTIRWVAAVAAAAAAGAGAGATSTPRRRRRRWRRRERGRTRPSPSRSANARCGTSSTWSRTCTRGTFSRSSPRRPGRTESRSATRRPPPSARARPAPRGISRATTSASPLSKYLQDGAWHPDLKTCFLHSSRSHA